MAADFVVERPFVHSQIDLCGREFSVSEQFSDEADMHAVFKQGGGA